jgi:hypothetical protein
MFATRDDQDVEFSEVFLDVIIGGIRFEDDALRGLDGRGGGGIDALKGGGSCKGPS